MLTELPEGDRLTRALAILADALEGVERARAAHDDAELAREKDVVLRGALAATAALHGVVLLVPPARAEAGPS